MRGHQGCSNERIFAMGDPASGHCQCDRCRVGTWIIWIMLSFALLLTSAAVFLRALGL
jgi:hypothetical protein